MHATKYVALLSLAAMFAPAVIARSDDASTPPEHASDAYAEPGQLIDIGAGRRLNLRCTGSGSPTVILEAGFGADSLTWWRLQPMLESRMRVCAYDRAGYGFSDGGPLPRSVDAEVADLHTLVRVAKLARPAIFVGHSIGTNIVRLYDTRFPEDVAGMVLVDPPPQGTQLTPEQKNAEAEEMPATLAMYRRCEQGAQQGQLANPPADLQRCLRGPDPRLSDRVNVAARANKSKPAFWQTIISGSQAKVSMFDKAIDAQESHGSKPLIVLTAGRAHAAAPDDLRPLFDAAQAQTHAALAKSSTHGRRVTIGEATHDIQMDVPRAVFDAVIEVKSQLAR